MYYTGTSAVIRTPSSASWTASNTTIPEHGLLIGSLSSGLVLNGANLNAVNKGTLNLSSYPYDFAHNGFHSSSGQGVFSNPFQVRLSGFGAALTIEEMETYSAILNEFKSIY